MNPDSPLTPREALEARLTALLLGELSAEDAAAVRRAIEQDANLARLHERLKHTIELVREVAARPAEPAAAQAAPLKLSDERRQKLLAHFKTVAPREFAAPPRRATSWLVPLAAAAAIIVLLGVIVMPKFGMKSEIATTAAVEMAMVPGVQGQVPDSPPGAVPYTTTFQPVPPPAANRSAKEYDSVSPRNVFALKPAQANEELKRGEIPATPAPTTRAPAETARARIILPSVGEVADVGNTHAIERFRDSAAVRGFYDNNINTAPSGGLGGGFGGGGGGGSVNTLDGAVAASSGAMPGGQLGTGLARDEAAGLTHRYAFATDSSDRIGGVQGAAVPARPSAQPAQTGVTSQDRLEGAEQKTATLGGVVAAGTTLAAADEPMMRGSGGARPDRGGAGGGGGGGGLAFGGGGGGRGATRPPATSQPVTPPALETPAKEALIERRLVESGITPQTGNDFARIRSIGFLSADRLSTDGRAAGDATHGAAVDSFNSFDLANSGTLAAESRDKVAVLGDVPALGRAFRSEGKPAEMNAAGFIAESRDKMPILKDVPLLGSLFQGSLGNAKPAISGTATSGYVDTSEQWNLGVGNKNDLGYQFRGAKADGFNGNVSQLAWNEQARKGGELALDDSLNRNRRLDESGARGAETPVVNNANVAGYINLPATQFKDSTLSITPTEKSKEAAGSATRAFRLNNADPGETANELAALFPKTTGTSAQQQFGSGRMLSQSQVSAVPDYRTGSIIVSGDQTLMPEVEKMVAALDTDRAGKQEVFSWKTENTDPKAMLDLLQKLVPNQTSTGSGPAGNAATAGVAGPASKYRIVLPSETADAGRGTAALSADLETRQVVGITDAQLAKQIAQVTDEANRLRKGLSITDSAAASSTPTPLLEESVLQHFKSASIERALVYIRKDMQLSQLKELLKQEHGKDKLRDVLPTMVNDPFLSELTSQLNMAQQKLVVLKKDYAAEHPEVVRVQAQVDDLKTKVDGRIDGIMASLQTQVQTEKAALDTLNAEVEKARKLKAEPDAAIRRPATNAPIPQPEVQTADNAWSTFSLNVSDVAFKLTAASLEKGQMPDAASVRSEEFINAFDYRDPEPPPGVPIGFAWERARYPFAHNRDLLRFSVKTAALGRQPGRPLNLVLLLDNSGSMERADRVQIIREALRVLATQLQPQDTLSVITFARTARLWVDGVPGNQAGAVFDQVGAITPQGGTNLEEAMRLAYETALRHYLANGINRVVVLTDGAANLGNVEPEALKQSVEAHRKQGIALDAFGIGWEGFNDDLLEVLTRNGDGRYGFINSPEEAATEFAGQLAGALHVAASDVKVQVEFNPRRVTAYRQIGYAKHQLTKEQFRDNTVNAAQIAAAEAGNALYTVEANPNGAGPLCTVRVRFRIPGTADYREHAWDVPFTGNAVALEQASPAMRLAATASAFSEWLVASPFAAEVTPDRLLGYLRGVPEVYGADARPKKLEWMIRQAKSIAGR